MIYTKFLLLPIPSPFLFFHKNSGCISPNVSVVNRTKEINLTAVFRSPPTLRVDGRKALEITARTASWQLQTCQAQVF